LTLVLHPLVIAECCWVLESKRYGYMKEKIKSWPDVDQLFYNTLK
jgi:hypothetical protein